MNHLFIYYIFPSMIFAVTGTAATDCSGTVNAAD